MAKEPPRNNKHWTPEEQAKLRRMAPTRPVGIIADTLDRTEDAVRSKAHRLHVPLAPPERPPYGRPGGQRPYRRK